MSIKGNRPVLYGLVAFILVASAAAVFLNWGRPDLKGLRADLRRHYDRGNFEQAEVLCQQILRSDPFADDIRIVAADCAAKGRRPEQAVLILGEVSSDDSSVRLQAGLMRATLLHRSLFHLGEAELEYRKVLAISPDEPAALQGLVELLAICGRRREALPFLFELVRIGKASDLLIIAARPSGSIQDPELLKKAHAAVPKDSSTLVGLAADAARNGKLDEAIRYCRDAIAANPSMTAAHVALGEYLLEAGRDEDLAAWQSSLTEEARTFPETWQVLGHLFERRKAEPQAIQAFTTAVQLAPDLKTSNYRLSILLRQAGDEAAADECLRKLDQLRELEVLQDRMFERGQSDPTTVMDAIRGFQKSGRVWEALGWATLGLEQFGTNPELLSLQRDLRKESEGLPLTQYPLLAQAERLETIKAPSDNIEVPTVPANGMSAIMASPETFYRDVAAECGLSFRYRNGIAGPATHRMFEFTGGGIGVIDLDLDDYPDVFLSQGGLWHSDDHVTDANDVLLRNLDGLRFVDVSNVAGIADVRFGQGVAVGDVNNDGFPDVMVANIGANILWLNCGDGTFVGSEFTDGSWSASEGVQAASDGPANPTGTGTKWSSSAALADLDRDGAADLYVVNYLAGKDVFTRTCTSESGRTVACIPTQFDAASDQVFLNRQDGSFQDVSPVLDQIPAGKGLGILVFSPENNGAPTIYVANDTTPNMLLRLDRLADGQVEDVGMSAGVAVNASGKPEGSMGIAAGDINFDGMYDLFVTNFFNESNTFYQQVNSVFFDDRTQRWNLRDSSLPLLGFGTHFVDVDGDTLQELFVANGHVDDLQWAGKPYRMKPQLFALNGNQFQELSASERGSYFDNEHLGRAVAVLDWNRDRKPDLLVGHLDEDYALLSNKTEKCGNRLSLRLIGTSSARDAIPSTATYIVEQRVIVKQTQSGNGYMCSNQNELLLSLSAVDQLSELTICWPTGDRQTLRNLKRDDRCAVIENRDMVYRLPD